MVTRRSRSSLTSNLQKKGKERQKPKKVDQRRRRTRKKKEEAAAEDEDEEEDEETEASEKKTIVIEHCKQHKLFKEKANEVKEGLEKVVHGIIVTLNPDKLWRGCFEIREEGGETFISLLDLKKPFTQMTELDMKEVVANIQEKIK